jgi:hypothetical protein
MTAIDSMWLERGGMMLGADPELAGAVDDMPNEAGGRCRLQSG